MLASILLCLVGGAAGAAALAVWLAQPGLAPSVLVVAFCCASSAIASLVLLPLTLVGGAGGGTSLATFWRAVYWTTLVIGWVIADALIELQASGDFAPSDRLRSALRRRAWSLSAVLALAVCAAAYLLVVLGMPVGALLDTASLLINAGGLLVLSLLLGHGLVALPLSTWRRAHPIDDLRARAYALAGRESAHRGAARRLRRALADVSAASAAAPPDARTSWERDCWEVVMGRHARASARLAARGADVADGVAERLGTAWGGATARAPSDARLAALHRSLVLADTAEWRAHASLCLDTRAGVRRRAALAPHESGYGGAPVARARGLWLGVLRRPCARLLAVCIGLGSVWLAIAEACLALGDYSPRSTEVRRCPAPALLARLPSTWRALYALAASVHAVACTAHAARTSRLLGDSAIVRRGTDGYSLLTCAAWAVRLSAPLCAHADAALAGGAATGASDVIGLAAYHRACATAMLVSAALTAMRCCGGAMRVLRCAPTRMHGYDGRASQRSAMAAGQRLLADAATLRPFHANDGVWPKGEWAAGGGGEGGGYGADDEAQADGEARALSRFVTDGGWMRWLGGRWWTSERSDLEAPLTPRSRSFSNLAEAEDDASGSARDTWNALTADHPGAGYRLEAAQREAAGVELQALFRARGVEAEAVLDEGESSEQMGASWSAAAQH